jgi:hypothetical protein
MNAFFKTIIAGYGAKKLGGGCISTILIFIVIYWALGNCNSNKNTAPARPASLIEERTVAAKLDQNTKLGNSIVYLANH